MTSSEVVSLPVPRKPADAGRRQDIPRWHQELRAAKNQGQKVRVQLAVEASFADDDCIFVGTVMDTDKTGVKFNIDGVEAWVNWNFVVGTEVLAHD